MLRNIRHDLHTAGHDTLRPTVANSISRSSGASKALGQLLDKCAANIVGGNVNSVSDTKHHERALSGKRQTRLRSIEASSGGLLDFANPHTLLADDRANQNVRDEKTKRVGLGLRCRRLLQRLLVQCANDKAKRLGNG